ncbi:MAG: TIM barrel protein, partial [Candidatus Kerfeldbacteria bacterium]|nr:TIM barrel protein [Candidatus Kerfeldbacteria bacterium]
MMRFGAHVSIAGGVQEAPKNAAAIGCEVFQMFSRSPRGGPAPQLTKDVVDAFRAACEKYRQAAWYIHTPYYINLASSKAAIRSASVRVIREELERGTALGATAVMTHIGSAKDMDEKEAQQLVIQGLRKIVDGYTGS